MLWGDIATCRCQISNNNVYDDVDDDDEDDDDNNNGVSYVMRPILLVMWTAF